jgi:hypothetical protein
MLAYVSVGLSHFCYWSSIIQKGGDHNFCTLSSQQQAQEVLVDSLAFVSYLQLVCIQICSKFKDDISGS